MISGMRSRYTILRTFQNGSSEYDSYLVWPILLTYVCMKRLQRLLLQTLVQISESSRSHHPIYAPNIHPSLGKRSTSFTLFDPNPFRATGAIPDPQGWSGVQGSGDNTYDRGEVTQISDSPPQPETTRSGVPGEEEIQGSIGPIRQRKSPASVGPYDRRGNTPNFHPLVRRFTIQENRIRSLTIFVRLQRKMETT